MHTIAEVTGAIIKLTKPFLGRTATGVRLHYRKFDMAIELAKTALECTSNKEVMAESNYIIGRCFHAQGQYDMAHMRYSKASRALPPHLRRRTCPLRQCHGAPVWPRCASRGACR